MILGSSSGKTFIYNGFKNLGFYNNLIYAIKKFKKLKKVRNKIRRNMDGYDNQSTGSSGYWSSASSGGSMDANADLDLEYQNMI